MKIPYKHLTRHLHKRPSIEEISDSLFQLGHEHKILDNIFDIEITPNRGDCLSLLGVCRDLNVFHDSNLDIKIHKDKLKKLEINFDNEESYVCPKISFLKIEVEKINDNYKDYIQSFFDDLNHNKNNFFTDISNYLLYEIGQPTHCYDFEKINNKKIVFRLNRRDIVFKSLLNQKINLKKDNCDYVFTLDDEPINIAGIIGGKESSCSKSTKTVLIECAYFKPEAIIGKSTYYDIQSEAAYKFERGVDHELQEFALRRFIEIVKDHSKIKNIEYCSYNFKKIKKNKLEFNNTKISKIIGFDVSKNEQISKLEKLGFIYKNSFLSIPSYRNDITHINDIAEEIARVIGYDNIPSKKISIINKKPQPNKINEQLIKSVLIDNGFFEVINFPFVSEKSEESIIIDNPLDSNKSYMRTSLKQSLISNLNFNERRQKDSIKLFEISDVYFSEKRSKKVIGIIASGRKGKNYKDFSKKIDSSYLMDILSGFVTDKALNIEQIDRKDINTKINDSIFYCEINLENLTSGIEKYNPISHPPKEFIKFKKISEFPSSYRDISYSIDGLSKITEIEGIISTIENKLIKELFIFDFYENIKTKTIKLGFRIIFQSYKKTLRDSEVERIMQDIIKKTTGIDGVEIPGIQK